MILKSKSKLLALIVALAVAFTMMPMMGAPVYAASKSNFYSGADVLRDGSNTPGAATVHMAGTKWRVIGYGASQEGGIPQVASSADTMTLIAGDNLKTGVQFNSITNQVNTYKGSNLYNEVNALTDDINGIFSKGEKEGIVPRDLKPGDYTDQKPYTNGIAGDEVKGALLWPLSTQEAFYMDSELRNATSHWWLRSPGYYDYFAAVVDDLGNVDSYGYSVSYNYFDVRPAFNFNLSSVIFTSAAAGGKPSDTVGADSLQKINEYMSSKEWKLTLKDDVHSKFAIPEGGITGKDKKLTIKYSKAAVDEKTEYISAIVKTNTYSTDGERTGQFASWYGKLALAEEASGANDPSCELVIPDGLEAGDEIYVFNEQCNADAITKGETTTPAETDYASELIKVYTAPNAKITEQPKDLTLTYGDTTGNELSVKADAATGNTLSYQWYYKDNPNLVSGAKVDNATSASYTVPTDQNVGKKLYYYCVVTEKDQYGVEISSESKTVAVTVSKAKLTIKPKDQTFAYNGEIQGPGDASYEGTQVDEYVSCEGLIFKDYLSNLVVDGQGKDAGIYDLEPSAVNIQDGKGNKVNDNYDITLENGKLIIGKVPVTITADDKSSKAGETLKELTYKVKGDIVEGDDLGITVSTDANKDKAGTYDIKVGWNNNKNYEATRVNGKYTVTAEPTPDPPKPIPPKPIPPKPIPPKPDPPTPKVSKQPSVKIKAGKKSLTLGWIRIKDADGYDIFFARCNHSHKKIVCRKVKNIKGNNIFTWKKSGLKKGIAYKSYVKAYVIKNDKKKYVYTSPVMHAYTGNSTKKYTNAKSVSIKNIKKGKLSIKKGKVFKLKAKVNKLNKKKKLMTKSHAPVLRYMSSDKKIATVSSKGKIKAKAKGKCYIYAYAHNGVPKKVTVTVKR